MPLEEIALKDLVKHPRLFIIYGAFLGIGWLIQRVVPDDCQKEVARWQNLYYSTARGKDSVQSSKDVMYEDLLKEKHERMKEKLEHKKTDSLILTLGKKADHILKR